jgi:hypothetical protein
MLLAGIALFCLGLYFSPFTTSAYEPLQGTLALGWVSPDGKPVEGIPRVQNQQFTISVDATSRTLWIQYVFTAYIPGDYWFQAIVPFTLAYEAQAYGNATWNFLNVYPYGSIIRIHYVIDPYNWTNPRFLTPLLSTSFQINQSFIYDDRGTYTITLPYGQGIPYEISQAAESWSPGIGVTDGGTQANIIEVSIPVNSVLVQAIPGNPSIERPGNYPSILFLKWTFDSQLPMVVVSFTMPNELDRYANRSLVFGLLIGSGVGIAADGFTRCYYDTKLFGWIWKKVKMRTNKKSPRRRL